MGFKLWDFYQIIHVKQIFISNNYIISITITRIFSNHRLVNEYILKIQMRGKLQSNTVELMFYFTIIIAFFAPRAHI